MKKFPLLLFFVFFPAFAASAQINQTLSCPKIEVSGEVDFKPKAPMIFTASISKEAEKYEIKYKWAVANGEILEGQGTTRIKVKFEPNTNVTATLEVIGLPDSCASVDSETGSVAIDYRSILVEEYGKIIFAKERAKLDTVAARLSEDEYFSKYATVHFIFYLTNKQKPAEIKARQANIEKYLIEIHKIPKNRITFVLSDSDVYLTRIWLVPPSADAPQP